MRKVSFCTTCANRLWQLRETLLPNLAALPEGCEISLVDFWSKDGLADWVWSNCREEIQQGRLNFFQATVPLQWHVAKAKNAAHRIARGDYLFSLDADNRITESEVERILRVRERGNGCWQFSGVSRDGSYGRIGLPSSVFFDLGGYDESLLAMAAEDYDLLKRMMKSGLTVERLTSPEIKALQNEVSDKALGVESLSGNIDIEKVYVMMDMLNRRMSDFKLARYGWHRRHNFGYLEGLLNGVPAVLYPNWPEA
jgi:hypothetical protein